VNTWLWILVVVGSVLAGMGIGVYLVLRTFRKGMNW
jgi:uncharacterized protein YneF (UPF0154 family)